MDAAYPPLSVPASADYFLALFRLDDNTRDLTADDSAIHLASALNEFAWDGRRALRDQLSACFAADVAADFDREFPTLRRRTVGDVCRFLAERVPRPAVRPWLNDRAAGAFLTVRHHLAAAGADVSEVRPSALLEPFLRRHPRAFDGELYRLAPGLPTVHQSRPVVWLGAAVVFVGVGFAVVAWLLRFAGVRIGDDVSVGVSVPACFLGTLVAMLGYALPPRRVTFGDLVTFRDLARAVAARQPA